MKIIHLSQEKLKIKIIIYKHDVFITGHKGEGKTSKAKEILELIGDHTPYWIHSPQLPRIRYEGYGMQVNTINELIYGHYIYTGVYNDVTFHKFINRVLQFGNLHIILDDIHENVHKHSVQMDFGRLVQSGRNIGIASIFISTRPQAVPNWILENVNHVFAFYVDLYNTARWLAENYFGEDAYILLTKDKRQGHASPEDGYPDIDVLPEHSYLYRDLKSKESVLCIND